MNDASAGGSASDSLSGTATAPAPPAVSLSVPSIGFTMVAGSVSAPQTVTLTNTGGTALTLSGIALSGAGINIFTLTTTCGTTLPAGANCTISATFAPKVAG